MSTVLTAEKMHIQDAPRRLRFWRPDAAAKTFTLPAWALIVLTLIAPITIVIVMSFTDYQLGNTEVRWVGLENYSTLVLGDDFLRALKNTVLYAVLTVPASVFVGLMLALLVNQVKIGSRVYRALFFLPVASTLVAMAMMQGLTSAIVNPCDQRLMETIKTCDIIKNHVLYSDSYLEL